MTICKFMTQSDGSGLAYSVEKLEVKADASRQRHHEDDDDNWGGGGRAINEYLDALHEDGSSIAPPTPPKKVSQTDTLARWTSAPGGPACYAYSTNYLVDTKAGYCENWFEELDELVPPPE